MSVVERKVLAIIPARGGSKRLPRKNVLTLAGKPLIAWTIEAAVNAHIFDRVMVTTDDAEIEEIAKAYGAEVPFRRPDELSGDAASSIDVIKHSIQWYQDQGIDFTDVILLQPTSPLRDFRAITNAWQLYLESDVESVISVCEVEHPVEWTYCLDTNGLMSSLFNNDSSSSNNPNKKHRLNGAIYIANIEYIFNKNKLISTKNSVGFVMDRESSIDIDSKIDFQFADFLMQKKYES